MKKLLICCIVGAALHGVTRAWDYEYGLYFPAVSPWYVQATRPPVNGVTKQSTIKYDRGVSHTSQYTEVKELNRSYETSGTYYNLSPGDNFGSMDWWHYRFNCHAYTFDVDVWWNSAFYVDVAVGDEYNPTPTNQDGSYQWGSQNILVWPNTAHSCVVHSFKTDGAGHLVVDEVYSKNGSSTYGAYRYDIDTVTAIYGATYARHSK